MTVRTAERVAAEKAVVLFEHFGWTWTQRGGKSVKPFVPTVDEIEATLEHLTESAYGENGVSASSGRLRVDRDDRENGEGTRYYLDLAETNVYTGEVME